MSADSDQIFHKAIQLYNDGKYKDAYEEIEDMYNNNRHEEYGRAVNFVGTLYEIGEYFDEDKVKAFNHYGIAAEAGSLPGMMNLGSAYYNGVGVEKDEGEGVKWWRIAADKSHPDAQHLLAWALWHGFGVESNKKEAIDWYCKAVEGKNSSAMYELGMIYIFDQDSKNEEKGLEYIQAAVEQDNHNAKRFVQAHEDVIEMCSRLKQHYASMSRKDAIFALHKSIQHKNMLSVEEQQRYVWNFIMHDNDNVHGSEIETISYYLLLLAHVTYLRDEAPPDEQNICMLTELLDARYNESTVPMSDIDRLYDMLREKNDNHPALKLYDMHKALTSSKSYTFSFSSQVAASCRNFFPEIGPYVDGSSVNDIFGNASKKDVASLADILAYSFNTVGASNLDLWGRENWWKLRIFRKEVVRYYKKLKGDTRGITYQQLLANVSKPFSKSAIKGCLEFFREFK